MRRGHVWGGGEGGRGKDMYGFDNQVSQPRSQIITDLQYKVELQLILDCMHILLHAYSKCGCHKRFFFLFWLCASKYIVISLLRSCKQKCPYFSYIGSISRDSLSEFSGTNTRQYGVFVSCFLIVNERIRFI